MEEKEPSSFIDGNVNWYSHFGGQDGDSLKNEASLPYDPEIPFPAMYQEKTLISNYTWLISFISKPSESKHVATNGKTPFFMMAA